MRQELCWPSGRLMACGEAGADGRSGEWTWFDESGCRRWQGEFHNSRLDGPVRAWYADGSRRKAGLYRDGERTGQWKCWHRSGVLMCIGAYDKGRMTGEWDWYDSTGTLIRRATFGGDGRLLAQEARFREVELDPGDTTVCGRCGVTAIVAMPCESCGLLTEAASCIADGAYPEITGPPDAPRSG
jgi:hypothetical protein